MKTGDRVRAHVGPLPLRQFEDRREPSEAKRNRKSRFLRRTQIRINRLFRKRRKPPQRIGSTWFESNVFGPERVVLKNGRGFQKRVDRRRQDDVAFVVGHLLSTGLLKKPLAEKLFTYLMEMSKLYNQNSSKVTTAIWRIILENNL